MKHLLLSATLLLFASNLAAQLHVRPNPSTSTDSYIYANDVVLYVENGIDLVVNNDPETRASIYLRGDSQLIQGDKVNSENSGNGHLSVWQRGYANAFDYNYWASPVGNPNDAAILVGNTHFGIPRIFDVQNDGGNPHKTWSRQQQATSSLNGAPSDVSLGIGPLQISNRWIYTMRAQSGYANWIYIGGQNGIGNGLAPGEGFTMKGTGTLADGPQFEFTNNQLYDFRGRPNDGDIQVIVAGSDSDFQETLTGNPYPSALDMAAFLMDPDNNAIVASAYYWESDPSVNSHYLTEQQGGYAVWQPGGGYGGTYVPAVYIMYDGSGNPLPGQVGNGNFYERRFAPIGQGFMVRGIANGTITFKNSMRRHVKQGADTYSEFRSLGNVASLVGSMPIELPTKPQLIYPSLRFQVEVNQHYAREMVLIFAPETTPGVDRGWDSEHPLLISSGDAFWKLDGTNLPYLIQTRPYDYYDLIPISFRVKNGMNTFKINVLNSSGLENLAKEQDYKMYLYDQLTNQYQILDLKNSATIHHSSGAGLIEDRYYIVFRRGIQDVASLLKNNEVNMGVFQNNPLSKLQLSNPDMYDIKNASVYDMRGRLVITQNEIGKVSHYEFSTQGLSSGVYLVVLTTSDNQMMDYKITIHNKN